MYYYYVTLCQEVYFIISFRIMTDSDSEPERASSVGSVKLSYDHVPEDMDIKVKVYNAGGEREAKFLYPLTEGSK